MDEFFRCIHGKPISIPSVRMECKQCAKLAREQMLEAYWRVRYKLNGMVW